MKNNYDMKYYAIFLLLFIFISCKKKKVEFKQTYIFKPHYLIKNPPENDSLLESTIKVFLTEKTISKSNLPIGIDFYKYNWNTAYFLENEEDPGGFSSMELIDYSKYKVASYILSKCKKDTTKLLGTLYFYGNRGAGYRGVCKTDTLLYK